LHQLPRVSRALQRTCVIQLTQSIGACPKAFTHVACRHQREVGTGYFDTVSTVVSQGQSSTTALAGSTETAQF